MSAVTTPENPTDKLISTIGALGGRLEAMEKAFSALNQPHSATGLSPGTVFATPKDPTQERTWGFKSLGEFCKSVYHASQPACTNPDKRLFTKAVSGMSEGVGADGGFLIPPEFSNTIMQRVYQNDLLSRTTSFTVTGNNLSIPAIDETSRANGSRFGGIQMIWLDEAGQITATKPRFKRINLLLHKLAGLAYMTEELLADAPIALEQFLLNLFTQEANFVIGDAIINGTGGGMPLGVMQSGCKIAVPKETGQAAATVVTENIVKMWSRMFADNRANAVWLINQDVEPQLLTMTIGVGTGGQVTYMPPGGLSDKPYATLMGRPVLPIEFCQTLGTEGDIILADLSQYLTLRKGEVTSDSSIHLRFDFAETAFRVLFRIDGQPWWASPLTPKNGTATKSPFVTLATRS